MPVPTPPTHESAGALRAYVLPMAWFAVMLAVPGLVRQPAAGGASLFLTRPEYWLYPLQAAVCAGALAWGWRHYRFRPLNARAWTLGLGAGLAALAVWISPQVCFGATPRTGGGFDPTPLADRPGLQTVVLAGRFLRLVVVVPLVEEVFWRGFLLRFLVREDFGGARYAWTPWSFGAVSVGFMLEHGTADWPAALVVGVLYNGVAIRTQSLGACVLAHAVTNAGLGCYVLTTRQWGFW